MKTEVLSYEKDLEKMTREELEKELGRLIERIHKDIIDLWKRLENY